MDAMMYILVIVIIVMSVLIIKAIWFDPIVMISSEFKQMLRDIDPQTNWGDNKPMINTIRANIETSTLANKTRLLRRLDVIDCIEYKKVVYDNDRDDFDRCTELSIKFLADLKKQLKCNTEK